MLEYEAAPPYTGHNVLYFLLRPAADLPATETVDTRTGTRTYTQSARTCTESTYVWDKVHADVKRGLHRPAARMVCQSGSTALARRGVLAAREGVLGRVLRTVVTAGSRSAASWWWAKLKAAGRPGRAGRTPARRRHCHPVGVKHWHARHWHIRPPGSLGAWEPGSHRHRPFPARVERSAVHITATRDRAHFPAVAHQSPSNSAPCVPAAGPIDPTSERQLSFS